MYRARNASRQVRGCTFKKEIEKRHLEQLLILVRHLLKLFSQTFSPAQISGTRLADVLAMGNSGGKAAIYSENLV